MKSKWLHINHYRKIFAFLGKKVAWLFSLGIVIGLLLFIVEVAFSYGLQSFLKTLGLLGENTISLPWWVPENTLFSVLLFFLCIGSARCFLQWAQLYLQGFSSEELRFLLRTRLLYWAFHSESISSSKITTLINDRTNYSSALIQHSQTLLIQLTCGILLGCSLFYMEPRLTFICAAVLSLLLFPLHIFDKRISAAGSHLTQESSRINQQLLTSIRNLLLMQIYGTQKEEEAKAQRRSKAIRTHHLVYYLYNALKFALPQFVGLILICVIAISSQSHTAMSPGKLVSYFYLFVRFLQTISSAAQATSPIIHFWPQLGELAKWWADNSFDGLRNPKSNTPPEMPHRKISGPLGWKLDGICFTYSEEQKPLFENLTVTIEPGKSLVVTGPSGAGKSTFLNILLGSLNPQKGSVNIVTHDNNIEPLYGFRPYLLKSVGYVGAESFLIEGTVHENLLYGLQEKVDSKQIREALDRAECHFIYDLPNGLEHILTEQGQGLSAGQKQRLSLARALLRKPKVLILDEATANLDMDTESKLVATLAQLKSEMTIIAVTHRQALLQLADQVLKLA